MVKREIVYPELSYSLNGTFYKTHNEMGRFCREKQYAERLEEILKAGKIPYERELEIKNVEPSSPSGNRVDFFIAGKILIDLKAKRFITKEDYYQMLRYLEAANIRLGMIVNFRSRYLKPKRIVNPRFRE